MPKPFRPIVWTLPAMLVGAVVLVLIIRPGPVGTLHEIRQDYGTRAAFDALLDRTVRRGSVGVEWTAAAPEEYGADAAVLDSIGVALEDRATRALLVARRGRLLYERYAGGASVNSPLPTAALAKGAVASMTLLALVTDGVVALDDSVSRRILPWQTDSLKARVTLRHLASHASGLDDVRFPTSAERDTWARETPEWKREYYELPDRRFDLAVTRAGLLFDPGTDARYSGMGYYVLAYALATALHADGGEDLRHFLVRRVFRPLGIRWDAWRISYGESYTAGDTTLYALGSGAVLTARALARIGSLVATRGMHDGETLIAGRLFDEFACRGLEASPATPVPCLGWWTNARGAWPSLPTDAMIAHGADDQVLLVVPSLELIVVRLGGPLDERSPRHLPTAALDSTLFAPIIGALGLGTRARGS